MSSQAHKIYEFGPFQLEVTDHLLSRNGKPIPLTPKAFEVLVCLLEQRGHLVEKDDLMREVWADSFVEEGNVARTVWMLRNALGDDRNGHKYIQTMPKHGYRFIAEVRITENNLPVSSLRPGVDVIPALERQHADAAIQDVLPNRPEEDRVSTDFTTIEPSPESPVEPYENRVNLTGTFWRRHRLPMWMVAALFVLIAAFVFVFFSRRSDQRPTKNRLPTNPEAQAAYLRGFYACSDARNSQTVEEVKSNYLKGIEWLGQAVELEPTSAEGWSELADCGVWRGAGDASYYSMAKKAAESALKLDESSVKAHHALGFALWRDDWDRIGAEREFARAVEINGNGGNFGLPGYALFLSSDGRHDEAIRTMERAVQIDPHNYVNRHNLGSLYLRAKRYDEAIEKFNATIEIFPKQYWSLVGLGEALACAGRSDEAIAATQKAIENLPDPAPRTDDKMKALRLAWVYAKVGHREDALGILHEMEKLPVPESTSINVLHFAMVYAELGDKDNAFAWLRKAFDSHSQTLCWLKTSPEFEGLHGDPRFVEMLGRLGLEP